MQVGSVIPILRSYNAAETRSFYIEYLGFQVDWEHRFDPKAPLYMQVSRGQAVLHLSEHHGDCSPGSAVRIWVDDINAFHAEITQNPHPRLRPGIEEQPWGLREISITDPSYNRVIFAGTPPEETG